MPELPEVETTLRGISPHVLGKTISEVVVRRRDLRQAVSPGIEELAGQRITGAARRSKYLLLETSDRSTILIHLGMSGNLRITTHSDPWKTHDHVGILFQDGTGLRFHDPRRFGLVLRITGDPQTHPLLARLGPEPLGEGFTAKHLKSMCVRRSTAVKSVIMNAEVVVGVGNIYASESLFRAGINPLTPAAKLTLKRLEKLVAAIRQVLAEAIAQGGTTLRDFLNSNGQPGYFQQKLFVYGRKDEPCRKCGTRIRHAVIAQRSTYWCPKCQK